MPRANDMTHWPEIACQRGCAEHPTKIVPIHLGGPTRYRDLTPIPNRFAMDFEIMVWDTDRTPVDGGAYCPARDAVSETIISHGVWEPRETVVMMLLWEAIERCVFFDFGAQIGWFSTIAEMRGVPTHAWEADSATANVLARNLAQSSIATFTQQTSVIHRDRITTALDPLNPSQSHAPIVAKIDVEGAERDVIRILEAPIALGLVEALLMEVSPVFNDSYPDLVADLIDRGYEAYLMPPKHHPPHRLDSLADLAPEHISRIGVREVVASWHQEDVLFVQGGVEAWT